MHYEQIRGKNNTCTGYLLMLLPSSKVIYQVVANETRNKTANHQPKTRKKDHINLVFTVLAQCTIPSRRTKLYGKQQTSRYKERAQRGLWTVLGNQREFVTVSKASKVDSCLPELWSKTGWLVFLKPKIFRRGMNRNLWSHIEISRTKYIRQIWNRDWRAKYMLKVVCSSLAYNRSLDTWAATNAIINWTLSQL